MLPYQIRPMLPQEYPLLQDFLYHAIYQKEGDSPLHYSITTKPELKMFFENFGKEHDHCLVAEVDSRIIGAVWVLILAQGFGHVDAETPELAVSLKPEYRGKGIGTQLMQSMLQLLKQKGYRKVSLSVQKDNYACAIYQKLGFTLWEEKCEEFIMVYSF